MDNEIKYLEMSPFFLATFGEDFGVDGGHGCRNHLQSNTRNQIKAEEIKIESKWKWTNAMMYKSFSFENVQ